MYGFFYVVSIPCFLKVNKVVILFVLSGIYASLEGHIADIKGEEDAKAPELKRGEKSLKNKQINEKLPYVWHKRQLLKTTSRLVPAGEELCCRTQDFRGSRDYEKEPT